MNSGFLKILTHMYSIWQLSNYLGIMYLIQKSVKLIFK